MSVYSVQCIHDHALSVACGECDASSVAAIEAPRIDRDPEARKALASLRLSIAMATEQIDAGVNEIDAALSKAFCDDRVYPALKRILEMADVLRAAAGVTPPEAAGRE